MINATVDIIGTAILIVAPFALALVIIGLVGYQCVVVLPLQVRNLPVK